MEILKINSYYEVVRARSSSRKGGGEDQKEETKKKKKTQQKEIDRNEKRRCKRRTRRRGKRSRRRARGKICSVVAASLTHFLGSVSPKSHNRAFPNDMAGDTFP